MRRIRRELDWVAGHRCVHFFSGPSDAAARPLRGELRRADGPTARQWRSMDPEFPWEETTVLKRIGEGNSFFALIEDGVPKCYGWTSLTSDCYVRELGGICRIDTPAIWMWNLVTPPRWRGSGHYTNLLRHLRHQTAPLSALIFCDARNGPSRRGILRAGFLPWVTITRWRLGSRLRYEGAQPARLEFEKS